MYLEVLADDSACSLTQLVSVSALSPQTCEISTEQ